MEETIPLEAVRHGCLSAHLCCDRAAKLIAVVGCFDLSSSQISDLQNCLLLQEKAPPTMASLSSSNIHFYSKPFWMEAVESTRQGGGGGIEEGTQEV